MSRDIPCPFCGKVECNGVSCMKKATQAMSEEHRKLADSIHTWMQNYHPDEAIQLLADFERKVRLEEANDILKFCESIRDDYDHAVGVSMAGVRKVERITKASRERIAALQAPEQGKVKK